MVFDKHATAAAAELLRALALHLLGKTEQAKSYLERRELTRWFDQLRAFPGGYDRRHWLEDQSPRSASRCLLPAN